MSPANLARDQVAARAIGTLYENIGDSTFPEILDWC